MTPWLCKRDRKTLAADFRTILRSTSCPPEKIETIAAGLADKIGTDPEISAVFQMLYEHESFFPRFAKDGDAASSIGGLTLRDHFAGQALPALLENAMKNQETGFPPTLSDVATKAYAMADWMLKARAV